MYLYSSLQPPSIYLPLSLTLCLSVSLFLSVTVSLSLSLVLSFLRRAFLSHIQLFGASPTLITHPKCYSPLPSSLVPLCSLSLPNMYFPSNPATHHSYASFALLLPSIPLSVSGSSLRTFPDVTVQYCPRGQQHKTCSVAHKHTQCTHSVSMGS